MRIDALRLDAFGGLVDLRVEGLADVPLVVIVGPNESGKSTLAAFVETALYGFSPANLASHPYAPWDGSALAGTLELLLADGRRARIERRLGTSAPTGRFCVGDVSTALGNAPAPCVASVGRAVFRGLHAAPPDDELPLTHGAWDELERRLLLGLSDPRLRTPRDAAEALSTEARALWRPDRVGRPSERRLREELAALQRVRQEAARRHRRALELRDEHASLDGEVSAFAEQLARGRARLERAAANRALLARGRHWRALHARADALVDGCGVPPDPRAILARRQHEVELAEQRLDETRRRHDALQSEARLDPWASALLAEEDALRAVSADHAQRPAEERRLAELSSVCARREAAFLRDASMLLDRKPDGRTRRALSALPLAELAGRLRRARDTELELQRQRQAREHLAREREALGEDAASTHDGETLSRRRDELLDLLLEERALDRLEADGEGARPRPLAASVALLLGAILATVAALQASEDARGPWLGLAGVLVVAAAWPTIVGARPALSPDESARTRLASGRTRLQLDDVPLIVALRETEDALRGARERAVLAVRREGLDVRLRHADAGMVGARDALRSARRAVEALLQDVPVAPVRLAEPGPELLADLRVLQDALSALDEQRLPLQRLDLRARRRARRAEALARRLGRDAGSDPLRRVATWADGLTDARDAARVAARARQELPAAVDDLGAARAAADDASSALADFVDVLRPLDPYGDPDEGLRRAAEADVLRREADALERALSAEVPAWRDRLEEAETAGDADDDDHALERERVLLDDLAARLLAAGEARARLEEEARALEQLPGLADVDGEIDALRDELQRVRVQHDRCALLASVLRAADARWRARHEPDVLRRVSRWLARLTGDRWEQLLVDGDGEQPRLLVRARGEIEARPLASPLSRGTLDQMRLAFRLSLAERLDGDEPLPVLLDEAFASWDDERTGRAAELLRAVADQRQVLLFTTRPELAERLAVDAGARVVGL